jgi:hypothetical protein
MLSLRFLFSVAKARNSVVMADDEIRIPIAVAEAGASGLHGNVKLDRLVRFVADEREVFELQRVNRFLRDFKLRQ